MAREVNTIWNYCNDLGQQVFRREGRFLSGFDFNRYTTGASPEFDLVGSSTIDEVGQQYAAKRRAAQKVKLRWRKSFGRRRSLGWVPFKARAAKWLPDANAVHFAGIDFAVWDSYGLDGYAFRAGSFVEDARGRWYFCVQVAVEPESGHEGETVGMDLGLKQLAVTSDGDQLEHGHWYRQTQEAVGRASRARKKRARLRPARQGKEPAARRIAQVESAHRRSMRPDRHRRRQAIRCRQDETRQIGLRQRLDHAAHDAQVQERARRHRVQGGLRTQFDPDLFVLRDHSRQQSEG